jgi:hypothetical protein
VAITHCTYTSGPGPHIIGAEQCGWVPADILRLQGSSNPACPSSIYDEIGSQPARWAPWTHRPYCADTNYCVFTNSMFQGNHGISIITTPEVISSSLHLFEKSFGIPFSSPAGDPTSPPYEVRDIPKKGKGLVATQLIKKGDVFMVDYASIIADVSFPGRVKRSDGAQLLQLAVEQLPDPDKVLSLARSGTVSTHAVEDVLRTNTFSATFDDESYMALFSEISVGIPTCKTIGCIC